MSFREFSASQAAQSNDRPGDETKSVPHGGGSEPQAAMERDEAFKIDPNVPDAALKRAGPSGATSPERAPFQKPLNGKPETREAETNRRAVDRAEDEGMIVHPGGVMSVRPL